MVLENVVNTAILFYRSEFSFQFYVRKNESQKCY